MNLWILDTDHVSLFQRGNSLVVTRVSLVSSKNLATTIITVEEQLYGRLNQIKRAKSPEVLTGVYSLLKTTLEYFSSVQILNFNQAAQTYYQDLLKQKIRIGTQDLRIAAITLSVKGILVTRNYKDFKQVPNLIIEDWSIAQNSDHI